MKIVQIIGEGLNECWEFADDCSAEKIKKFYKDFEEQYSDNSHVSFDEYLENEYPKLKCKKINTEQVYI